jgi:DNA gyrase/topoisomerase IV subunit A
VIRRRTAYLLREAKKRAHVLEGMIYAVCDIDEVIALIRSSKTRAEAIEKLMERRYRIPRATSTSASSRRGWSSGSSSPRRRAASR